MTERQTLILSQVADERDRQDAKFGDQTTLPNGTGGVIAERQRDLLVEACNYATRTGKLSWAHILREEVAEALAETDIPHLRRELIQVAAVAVAWIEAIDGRQA
jgi:hypothetical protein